MNNEHLVPDLARIRYSKIHLLIIGDQLRLVAPVIIGVNTVKLSFKSIITDIYDHSKGYKCFTCDFDDYFITEIRYDYKQQVNITEFDIYLNNELNLYAKIQNK